MNPTQLQDLLKSTIQIANRAADFIRSEAKKVHSIEIAEKALNQLVSYVDETAESMIREQLTAHLPEARFIGEESAPDYRPQPDELCWIVDPLDGTTNFLHGLPAYAVSIGLYRGAEGLLGVVADVPNHTVYSAAKNGGAFCDDRPIKVTSTPRLQDTLIATGFPYTDFDRQAEYLDILAELMRTTRGLRRYGAAALDLCWVAAGHFDGFFEIGLSPWDVAAGSVIVREAGGWVTPFTGTGDYLFGETILAATPEIHSLLQTTISRHLRS